MGTGCCSTKAGVELRRMSQQKMWLVPVTPSLSAQISGFGCLVSGDWDINYKFSILHVKPGCLVGRHFALRNGLP